jgi:hypothetical protein
VALGKVERELNDVPMRLLMEAMRSGKRDIQLKIVQALEQGKPVSAYWVKRLAEIKKVYDKLNAIEKSYLEKRIPGEYLEARKIARLILEKSDISRKGKAITSFDALQAIIQDAYEMFRTASEGGLNQVSQLFRATQQRLISELQIDQAIASGLVSDNNIKGIKSNIEKTLYQKLVTDGRVFTVNTKTGGTRSFEPDYYAELVARTRSREAQTLGTVNMTLEYGVDLVQVSSHNTLTPICKPHEGKVYSITGSTPGYERLTDENKPSFHPNCWHVITPYIPHETDLGEAPIIQEPPKIETEIITPAKPEIPRQIPILNAPKIINTLPNKEKTEPIIKEFIPAKNIKEIIQRLENLNIKKVKGFNKLSLHQANRILDGVEKVKNVAPNLTLDELKIGGTKGRALGVTIPTRDGNISIVLSKDKIESYEKYNKELKLKFKSRKNQNISTYSEQIENINKELTKNPNNTYLKNEFDKLKKQIEEIQGRKYQTAPIVETEDYSSDVLYSTVIHELGHSIDLRNRFKELGNKAIGLSVPNGSFINRVTLEYNKRSHIPSKYGLSEPDEFMAETFTEYVLFDGKRTPLELKVIYESLKTGKYL